MRAQDAARIVEQHVKAAGGAKNISRIQSLLIEGTLTSGSDGKAGTFTLETKSPNRYYSEVVASDKTWIEAYSGKSAWRDDGGEIATCVGQESGQLEAAGQYYNARLLNLKKNRLALSLVGHAQVRGQDTWQVETTAANGTKREVYFDVATHLIVEEKASIGGVEETIAYSDYRIVDGVKLPYQIELQRGAETYQIAVTHAVVNGTIEDRVFDFPKKPQVPLPDLKALFKKIDENQKALRKVKENYAGTRTEEETEYDGSSGKVKKVETNQYTFFYLDGDEISTLVQKDGEPLSDEEQKKENEKTTKRIERIQKHDAEKEAKEEKDKEEGRQANRNDHTGIELLLRACQFASPRRERFRGRDVLVFDFEPNTEFKPQKLEEKVVRKLAGVVWIDEEALTVARLEAHFVGDLRIGGGVLANVQKGTTLVFEQAFINDEVWLPTYEEAHVGVRVLMLKGFKVSEVTRYSDYKRFNVETLASIGKPKETAGKPVSAPPQP